jgi:4-hydroxy-4-methyl-2-oxoglutarate aldolase
VTCHNGPRDNLAALAMLDHVKPGDVLMISTAWDDSGAVIGDHFAAVARQLGVVAIVTDGLVRDSAGIEQMGPPTFARGTSPNAGYKNGPGTINLPVAVGGVAVSPGDIVAGDRDGVVVVPRAQAEEVKAALARVVQNEHKTEARVRAKQVRRMWEPAKYAGRGVVYLD